MTITPAMDWVPRGVDGLEPTAWDAVRTNTNAIVVAGPGAGKTELLAQRACFLLETALCPRPSRILAISFKRDAARNLRDRVELRCGPQLGRRFDSFTFDAWAKSLLDRFRLSLPTNYRPTLDYEPDLRFANDAPLRDRLLSICESAGVAADRVRRMDVGKFFKSAISDRPLDPNLQPNPGTGMALTQALWQSALHSGTRSALPFVMISALSELLLRLNPKLIEALRRTYRFVFLDEFQDTTSPQYRLLHTAFHGSDAVLTAVGDKKQRIMLWAGAESRVFDNFTEHFAARRLGLIMNYRSAPRLVAIQQQIITALDPHSLVSTAVADGSGDEGECRLLKFENSGREAQYIADLIAGWIYTDGIEPEDICILARQMPDPYSQSLRAELSGRGISCRVQNELQDLLSEPLTTAVIDAFRIAAEGKSPRHWANLIDLFIRLRGIDSDEDLAREAARDLSAHLKAVRTQLASATTVETLAAVISDFLAFLGESDFRNLYPQYLQEGFYIKTTTDVAHQLLLYRSQQTSWAAALDAFMGADCVPVMSIHKSKGLEFHTVILLGLEDYPFRGITEGNGEEECNFFVAFSRAKKRVIFTTSDVRDSGRGARSQDRTNVQKFYDLLLGAGVVIEAIE